MELFMSLLNYVIIVLTVSAFAFQFHKTVTQGDASGISYISQSLVSIGGLTWLGFAGIKHNLASGTVNAVIHPLVITILYMSLRDNGVRKSLRIGIPTLFAVLGIVMATFFLLGMTGVIKDSPALETLALVCVFIGGTLTATAFMPQTFRTIKSKNVNSLSLGMSASYSFAQILWSLMFIIILVQEIDGNGIVLATNIWAVITAVVPTFVQFTLFIGILKWSNPEKKI